MKALTLWQPWASLVALGHKKVETRTWITNYRGPLAIHASLHRPSFLGRSQFSYAFQMLLNQLKVDSDSLPRGVILCEARLVHIEETLYVRDDIDRQERIFGNYEEGRYAWFLDEIRPLKVPIPAKGKRMLWEWTV